MARFDSSDRLDQGLKFDQVVAPVIPVVSPKKNKMSSKFKLELQKKTPAQKVTMGEAHIAAMTGNADFPVATRVPDDAAVLAAVNGLKSAQAAVISTKTIWRSKVVDSETAEDLFDSVLTARAGNCEAVKPNDPAALLTTALPMRGDPTPVGDLPAPSDVRATMGDAQGSMDVMCDAMAGASTYILEVRVHTTGSPVLITKVMQQSSITLPGLTSGTTYAFRMAAVGPNGQGPWSDEAVKMAP